jgi:hypothetical protein
MGFARGLKVKSALRLSGLLWVVLFLLVAVLTTWPAEPGHDYRIYGGLGAIPWLLWLLLFAAGGFLLLSFVLWLLMFVTDTIRHAIARAGSRYRHV